MYHISYLFSIFCNQFGQIGQHKKKCVLTKLVILPGCKDPGRSQAILSLCKLFGELPKFYNQSCIHWSFFRAVIAFFFVTEIVICLHRLVSGTDVACYPVVWISFCTVALTCTKKGWGVTEKPCNFLHCQSFTSARVFFLFCANCEFEQNSADSELFRYCVNGEDTCQ